MAGMSIATGSTTPGQAAHYPEIFAEGTNTCLFRWPLPGYELVVRDQGFDYTRKPPIWMIQFAYRCDDDQLVLDVLATDTSQGRPDWNVVCRFVSVMPHWDFNMGKWYTVIYMVLKLEAWDPVTRSAYPCEQPWQGVVDKIWVPVKFPGTAPAAPLAIGGKGGWRVPCKGAGRGRGKGNGKGKGEGKKGWLVLGMRHRTGS